MSHYRGEAMIKQILVVASLTTALMAQNGGQFAVTEGVIANGGGSSTTGQYSSSGTTGQPVAGGSLSSAQYTVQSGFWKPAFAPSAALASISGRVSSSNGAGIKSVNLSIRDASSGFVLTTISGPFGYYRFDGLVVGRSYVITLTAKRFTFPSSPMLIMLDDEISGLDWVANP